MNAETPATTGEICSGSPGDTHYEEGRSADFPAKIEYLKSMTDPRSIYNQDHF